MGVSSSHGQLAGGQVTDPQIGVFPNPSGGMTALTPTTASVSRSHLGFHSRKGRCVILLLGESLVAP